MNEYIIKALPLGAGLFFIKKIFRPESTGFVQKGWEWTESWGSLSKNR